MTQLNLNEATQAKLRDLATNYIHSFIYPRIPEESYKHGLVQSFVECFEKGTRKSPACVLGEVRAKSMEYWVATSNCGIVQVWGGENKTSVRNYLTGIGYGKVLKIVLVKEFNPTSFLEEKGGV